MSANLYVEYELEGENKYIVEGDTFFISEAVAQFEPSENYFASKKVPVDAEIDVNKLPDKAKQLFTGPKGSREKEWSNMVTQVKENGGPAVRVHRGPKAREIREKYAHRLIPSRWLDKWKDMGDDYITPLTSSSSSLSISFC